MERADSFATAVGPAGSVGPQKRSASRVPAPDSDVEAAPDAKRRPDRSASVGRPSSFRSRPHSRGPPLQVKISSAHSSPNKEPAFGSGSPYAGIPTVPGEDCTVGELRRYTLQYLKYMEGKMRELSRKEEQNGAQIGRLNADMNLYSRKFEVESVGNAVVEINQKAEKLDHDLNALKVQLEELLTQANETVTRDQAYLDRIAMVEQVFQEHVSTTFNKMSMELTDIRNKVEAVTAFPAGPLDSLDSLEILEFTEVLDFPQEASNRQPEVIKVPNKPLHSKVRVTAPAIPSWPTTTPRSSSRSRSWSALWPARAIAGQGEEESCRILSTPESPRTASRAGTAAMWTG